jgi:hypothetical protein
MTGSSITISEAKEEINGNTSLSYFLMLLPNYVISKQ